MVSSRLPSSDSREGCPSHDRSPRAGDSVPICPGRRDVTRGVKNVGLSVNRKGRPVAARGRLDRCWLVTGSWPEAKIRLPSPASPQSTHTSHFPHMRAVRHV